MWSQVLPVRCPQRETSQMALTPPPCLPSALASATPVPSGGCFTSIPIAGGVARLAFGEIHAQPISVSKFLRHEAKSIHCLTFFPHSLLVIVTWPILYRGNRNTCLLGAQDVPGAPRALGTDKGRSRMQPPQSRHPRAEAQRGSTEAKGSLRLQATPLET